MSAETALGAAGREVVFGAELAELQLIGEPDVQLVTAPVEVPAEVGEHLSHARPGWGWRQEVPIDPDDRPDPNYLRSLTVSSPIGAEAFRGVIAEVLEVMASLFGVHELGVRLANATYPPCPRLHVDRVQVRGVLTLVGRGSEYLLDHEVDRSKLGHGAGGLPDEASGLIVSGAQPRPLDAGQLCLFKGDAWVDNRGKGLVHRSPPADGNERWVVTVDLL